MHRSAIAFRQRKQTAAAVRQQLQEGEPSILSSGGEESIRFGPQTLQDGEAEIIAQRLQAILS
jgi:hypothetical protein